MNRLLAFLWHDVYRHDPAESGFTGPGTGHYKLPLAEFDGQLATLSRVRASGVVPVAITVDDGGVSYYTVVAERLESNGWRGHCFVTTGRIGRPGFLDAEQLRSLHRRGHLIGTHSVTHPARFAACPWRRLVQEWTRSKATLEDILGTRVTAGSVPGGYFSTRVAAAAGESGLELLFTSEPVTRLYAIDGVTVAGRYAVRRGCGDGFIRRLGALEPAARFREWAVWNGKKAAKRVFGAAYPRVTALVNRTTSARAIYQEETHHDER